VSDDGDKPVPEAAGKRRALLAAGAVALLGVLAYSNTFDVPFHLDDYPSIVKNPFLRDLRRLDELWYALPSRFVPRFTFALQYAIHGFEPWGYHLVNLACHIGTALLVWQLALVTFVTPSMRGRRTGAHAETIALFSGLIFVAHPIQTQAVTYIVQRDAVLAALFYLTALLCYAKARLAMVADAPPAHWRTAYAAALGAGLLGIFSKENVATLPLAVLLYEVCFFTDRPRRDWKYAVPFFFVVLLQPLNTFVQTLALGTEVGLNSSLDTIADMTSAASGASRTQYLVTQFRVLVTYLRLLVAPYGQNIDHDYGAARTLWELGTLLSLALHAALIGLAVRLFRRCRLITFCILWFYLTLAVESSVFPLPDFIFEHRLYLPMAGYALFLPTLGFSLLAAKTAADGSDGDGVS